MFNLSGLFSTASSLVSTAASGWQGLVIKVLLIAGIVAGLVAFGFYKGIQHEAGTIATLNAQLGKQKESADQFKAAADSCSLSVAALATAEQKQIDALQGQLAASRAATARVEDNVRKLLSAPRPAGLNECDAMQKELNDEIDNRHYVPPHVGSLRGPAASTARTG